METDKSIESAINKKFKLAEKFDWKMEQQIKGKLIKKE